MLGPHTITRLRASVVEDEYHNQSSDWSNPNRLDITGCSVQPGTGNRYDDSREAIAGLVTVWVPITADLQATDRVEWAGQTYNINGDLERWDFGLSGHVVVRLRKVAG